jgi:thiamine biosynthesis protein ThiC
MTPLLLDQLAALAHEACSAAEAGDLAGVQARLDERELVLSRLAELLPGTAPSEALALLERTSLESAAVADRLTASRAEVARQLHAAAVTSETLAAYRAVQPAKPPAQLDVRR